MTSNTTSFKELLRKFRQEEASSSSFMSGFIPAETPSTSPSSPCWWECSSETDEDEEDEDENEDEDEDEDEEDSSTTFSSSSHESENKKQFDTSSTSHWLAYDDQDNTSLGYSSSDEDSDEDSISSASSVFSDEDEKYFIEEDEGEKEKFLKKGEKYLVALGWWKVYRSGWWENSHGAKTHFEETYIDYRFSTQLPPIPEEDEEDEANSP